MRLTPDGSCERHQRDNARRCAAGTTVAKSSGEYALEGGAVRRLAVRCQHELDGEVEQRAEPLADVTPGPVRPTAELNVEAVPEVGERVPGHDRVDRRQPQDEV